MQSIAGQYDPQAKLIQDQQDALGGQETAAIAGADAAKNNAFRDIQNGANNMGMLYSGQGLENDNRYVGEKYAPAIAGIKQNTQQQRFQLSSALQNVRQQQSQQAYGMYNDQLNREQQERQFQQQQAAARAQAAASASQGLDFGALLGGMGGGQSADPMSAATGYAKTVKNQLLSAGNVHPFAREQVIKDIQSQFGLSPAQAQSIVYKNVFPDNWNGPVAGKVPTMLQRPTNIPSSLKFGGLR